jgi:hypothetical protein
VFTRIWVDDDWRALSARAQWCYVLVLSQPDLSYAGVIPYRPGRWARLAGGVTASGVEQAVAELETCRYVLVDRETGELLVRSFVRNDGVLRSPNLVKAMWNAYREIVSAPLREALDVELPDPSWNPSPNPSPNGSQKGLSPTRGVRGKGRGSSSSSVSSSSVRGTRVPDPFPVSDAMRAWASEHALGVDLERETDALVDWAKGKGETKKDWVAAWRNWMRRRADETRATEYEQLR